MNPLHILLLNYEFPPLGGGAANATYYLLKEYEKRESLQVDLITSSTGSYHEEQFAENVKIYYININKKDGNLHYQTNTNLMWYAYNAYRFGRQLLHENPYSLTHAFFGIPCGYVAMKLGLPYMVSLRGSDVPFYSERFALLDKLVFQRVSRRVWKNAASVVAVSQNLADLAARTAPGQPIQVVRNGVDCEEFHPDQTGETQGDRFIVLCVSRLIERKGLKYLFDAFLPLARRHKSAELHIVGDGPLRSSLEAWTREHQLETQVKFYGSVPHENVSEIYRAADIFVLPSKKEALGNVVLEAMASGLPIITSATGAQEMLNENGIVVSPESTNELTDAMEAILKDKQLGQQYSRNSRTTACTFTWPSIADEYIDLYRSAIGRNTR